MKLKDYQSMDIISRKMDSVMEHVWRMQCELRNKEGITGIEAMHHILLVLLSKSLTAEQCRLLKIPEDLSYGALRTLTEMDLFTKMYSPSNQRSCLLYHIRLGDRFGFTKDIAFKIKHESTLKFLYDQVDKIPDKLLFDKTDLVGDIYEHFINREGKTMKDLGQYFTDRSLIRYLVELAQPTVKDGRIESVWDPASGTGGFLIEYISYLKRMGHEIDWSRNKNDIGGNDINFNTVALLKQNLYYSFREPCGSSIEMQDSLVRENDTMYDVILGNPPFGVKGLKHKDMNTKIKALKINGTKGEILFLQLAMTHLKENGRCCLVVPEGVLFNSTKMYKKTREHLMTHFNLKKVIKVGEGEFFKNTGVKTSVLFFERKGTTQEVEFIQVNKVGEDIQEVPLMTVPIDKLAENEYSLNMNLYKEIVLDVNEEFEVKMLGDVFKYRQGTISATSTTNTGEFQVISVSDKRTHESYTNEGETLAICGHGGGSMKLQYTSEKCILTTLMYDISVNTSVINKKYMYYYLKEKVNELKETCLKGACQPSLNFEVFNIVKIPIPPLSVQERIVLQLDNINETEIAQSKVVIEGLQSSIEAIMKNTMGRGDLQEFRIGDICEMNTGSSLKADEKIIGEYPYYGSNGPIANYSTFQKDGEYIVTGRVGTVGKYHYVNGRFSICDNAFHIRNTSNNLTRYIYFTLQYNAVINCNDTVVSQVSKQYFKSVKIFLPPPEVQQEILERIEPKEELTASLQRNIARAEEEAKAIMDVLFN